MRKYFFVSIPKPFSFVITILLITLVMIAIGSYFAENPFQVFGDGTRTNITLEDIAENIYESINQ